MGLTKAEINLRRLLAALPHQTNQAKLAQYIVTLKEQLAVLTGESGQGNLPCISNERAKEYAEQIELAASKLNTQGMQDVWERLAAERGTDMGITDMSDVSMSSSLLDSSPTSSTSFGLRQRHISTTEDGGSHNGLKSNRTKQETADKHGAKGGGQGSTVKMDSATLELIDKHRHLQENLTDEMVELARQMKEASLSMNRAVQDSEKILDSTERAVEHSLASTNQANKRAQDIYKRSFKTGCVSWLLMFIMSCMFLLMVFLIRIT